MNKRIIFLLIACLLVLSAINAVAAGPFPDVPDTHNNVKAITELASLKIISGYPDGTFGPDKTITRAEFTKIVAGILNLTDVLGAQVTTNFPDVDTAKHWGAPYIKAVAQLGVIKGFEDGTFRPDQPVTFEQAVKMVVCYLGYEVKAVAQGGWPNGYVAVGRSIGVTLKAEAAQKEPAKRSIVTQMIYNSISIDKLELDSKGRYTTSKGTTIKSQDLKQTAISGIVLSVGSTTIDISREKIKSDEIMVLPDNSTTPIVLKSGTFNTKDSLGCRVDINYVADAVLEDVFIIKTFTFNLNNAVYQVKADQILKSKTSGSSFYYLEKETDTTDKQLPIENTPIMVFNGTPKAFNAADIKVDVGSVKLIDNNGNGSIDVLIVTSFKTIITSGSVSKSGDIYTINARYGLPSGTTKTYNPNDFADKAFQCKLNSATGSDFPLSSIADWNVVSIAEDSETNPKNVLIVVMNTSKSGAITSMADDKISIGNAEYKVTQFYKDNFGGVALSVNDNGYFYVNHEGRLVGVKVSEPNMSYGYLINAAISSATNGDKLGLRIFSSQNGAAKVVDYNAATNIKFNGEYISSQTKDANNTNVILASLKESADAINNNNIAPKLSTDYAQLVRFTLNGTNEITRLETAHAYKDGLIKGDDGVKLDTNYLYKKSIYYTSSLSLTYGSTSINIPPDAYILYVPNNRNDVDSYQIKTRSQLVGEKYYNPEVYNIKDGFAKVVVMYNEDIDKVITYKTPLEIITNLRNTQDSNGNAVITFDTIEYTGTGRTFTTDITLPQAMKDNIKIGNIIMVGYSASGKVANVVLVMDVNNPIPALNPKPVNPNAQTIYFADGEGLFGNIGVTSFKLNYGVVDKVNTEYNAAIINLTNTTDQSLISKTITTDGGTKIYMYNSATESTQNKITASTISAIANNDKIMVFYYDNYCRLIYHIRPVTPPAN